MVRVRACLRTRRNAKHARMHTHAHARTQVAAMKAKQTADASACDALEHAVQARRRPAFRCGCAGPSPWCCSLGPARVIVDV